MSAIWRNSISIVVEVVFDFDLPSFGMCLLNQKKSEHFWLLVSSLLIVRISDSWPSPDFFRFNFSFVRISKRLASLDLSLSHFGNEQKTFYKPQARNHSADWRSSPCWHHVYWTIPVSGQTVNNAHRTQTVSLFIERSWMISFSIGPQRPFGRSCQRFTVRLSATDFNRLPPVTGQTPINVLLENLQLGIFWIRLPEIVWKEPLPRAPPVRLPRRGSRIWIS